MSLRSSPIVSPFTANKHYESLINALASELSARLRPALSISLGCSKRICSFLSQAVHETWLPMYTLEGALLDVRRRATVLAASGDTCEVHLGDECSRIHMLARTRIHAMANNLIEAGTRASQNKDKIAHLIGHSPRVITDIRLLGFEVHNGGRQALLLEFDGASKLVYKPVSLVPDWAFGQLFALILPKIGRYMLKRRRCLPIGPDYGFLEYIEKETRRSHASSLERFYFRAGILTSFAYAFNVTDMHMENVIAARGYCPVAIDLETMLYRFPNESFTNRVTSTGLFQELNKPSRSVSGFQGGGRCPSIKLHVTPENCCYPTLRYQRWIWLDANRLRDGRRLANPAVYVQAIMQGFTYGYRNIVRHAEGAVQLLKRISTEREFRTRHLIRFTAYYVLHLHWLIQPASSSFGAARVQMNNRLRNDDSAAKPLSDAIVQAEEHDLLNGDVPYFSTIVTDNDLLHHSGIRVPNYFKRTALEELEAKIERLSESDLRDQLAVLRESLCSPISP